MPTRCSRRRSRPAPTTSDSDEDGHEIWTDRATSTKSPRRSNPRSASPKAPSSPGARKSPSTSTRRRRRDPAQADRRARRGRRRPERLGQLRRPRRRHGAAGLIILGLDPGLGTTGWGLIRAEGNRLSHLANGQLKTDASDPLPERLADLARQLEALIAEHRPDSRRGRGGVRQQEPAIDAQARPGPRRDPDARRARRASRSANMPRGWSRKRWSAPAMPKRRRSTPWSSACFPA